MSLLIVGDGDSCDVLHNCDVNAQCIFDRDLQSYACQCNPGYAGTPAFLAQLTHIDKPLYFLFRAITNSTTLVQ